MKQVVVNVIPNPEGGFIITIAFEMDSLIIESGSPEDIIRAIKKRALEVISDMDPDNPVKDTNKILFD